ncbi:biosynthetic-type acetolactate synthase large subunit [Aerococcus sanguinicola]|uniref:biosynthetic-type acetolactate synthase large subunit n=1 Tax=unclassified Aerococcus TaxID=2618060 RepID=UPI0008A191C9|nr:MULTISPECIES: biosynthetic-type acetolactate synthase large subunit [unclassified Aerococcus]KAB0647906.1 biosynthetic-type acetolactate synthase large subunit [Aerococcus sanguinicola]MDK6233399.1 biosynthetic-type acetolactate synthase large subunit [Aerococcus sp. UMB10185]MDK6855618.1 biosynthetic-type acetolactate synthase large subunit [Aerococcus sp. UMB7533]MDK8502337.1 biosynthetic-type acetolactate synthase large subunit [Aerococcus sp. UMB1112A]OFN02261.1 acetolactate synthase ca
MAKEEETKQGMQVLVEALNEEGVDVIFGYPGGAVLDLYDQFFKNGTNHVLARHEQGAGHMADGYARASGKTGVSVVTSGPGATNIVTAVATAQMDSVPMVVISGQVAQAGIGKDAFQETDVIGVMTPITKYCVQVRDARDIPRIIKEAFYIANSGRKGVVVVDIPKNVGQQMVAVSELNTKIYLPGYQPEKQQKITNNEHIQNIMEAIQASEKPLLLVGGGIAKAGAEEDLREFVHTHKIPVVATLLGLGAVDSKDPYFLGMGGMHGSYAANMALMTTDCLINIGSRFDDRVASVPDNFAPGAKIIHIDIDASEIGKVIQPDYELIADAKVALEALNAAALSNYQSSADWVAFHKQNLADHPMALPAARSTIRPEAAIAYLGEKTDGEALVVTDVGQHQMWAAQFYPVRHTQQFLTSGGLGTMGYGIPAAIGAAFGAKEGQDVVAIVGDGGFQMTNQELNILSAYDVKPKFMILNNEVLGMVHQWQDKFYGQRYSHSEFLDKNPDFVKLSEALGVKAARVSDPAEMEAAIDAMLAYDGPYVLEIRIAKDELVLPMVPAGKPNNEMEGLG